MRKRLRPVFDPYGMVTKARVAYIPKWPDFGTGGRLVRETRRENARCAALHDILIKFGLG